MPSAQLKETTMDPAHRTLLRITIDSLPDTARLVDGLMGRKPELRLAYIQEHAPFVEDVDI